LGFIHCGIIPSAGLFRARLGITLLLVLHQ
jgi:hypothetical protein